MAKSVDSAINKLCLVSRKPPVLKKIILTTILFIKMPFVMAIEVIISSTKFIHKANLPAAHECYVSQVVWEKLSSFFPQRIQQGRGVTIINNGDGTFFVRLSKNLDNYVLGDGGLYYCTCCQRSYSQRAAAMTHSYTHPGHHLYCPGCEQLFSDYRRPFSRSQGCSLCHITSGSW